MPIKVIGGMDLQGEDIDNVGSPDEGTDAATRAYVDAAVAEAAAATARYVGSRGTNLVTNGSLLFGDNTNFPGWTFDGSRAPSGGGSLRITTGGVAPVSAEAMPVDPSRLYRLSFSAAADSPTPQHLFGLSFFDIDGLQIGPEHYINIGSTVYLTQALSPGDTFMHLTGTSGWYNGGGSGEWYQRLLRFGEYANSYGYEYPPGGYSRNVYIGASYGVGAWNAGGLAPGGVHLRDPYNGPAIQSGTAVNNGTYGNSFLYTHGPMGLPTAFKELTAVVGEGSAFPFWPGTAYARFLGLPNLSGGTTGVNIGSLTFALDPVAESASAGEVRAHAAPTVPPGFLPCNGAAVSRTTYARLYAAIGNDYGDGDGSSTFNVPNIAAAPVPYIIRV